MRGILVRRAIAAAASPAVGFDTGYAATVGWTSKIGQLWAEFNRLYREINQRRKQALQS